jgi:hypothetical protein
MTDHPPLTVEACERRLAELAERITPAEPAPADASAYAETRPPAFGRLVEPDEVWPTC